MENSDEKKYLSDYSVIKDQLKGMQKDHDILIELRKDIQNMQNEMRHYMTTKADQSAIISLKEGMVEWKKDLQDFTTSLYRGTQEQVKVNTTDIEKVKKDVESLVLTRAKQLGIYLGVSFSGGVIATIIPLLFRFIKA